MPPEDCDGGKRMLLAVLNLLVLRIADLLCVALLDLAAALGCANDAVNVNYACRPASVGYNISQACNPIIDLIWRVGGADVDGAFIGWGYNRTRI